jgi:Zn-dependent protease
LNGGIAIARIAGIEIRVGFAWAFFVALVTIVGSQQAAELAPGMGPVLQLIVGLLVAFSFLATVVAHELGHAVVGRRRGVPATAIQLGYIGGLAPLAIEAARPRDELVIAIVGPLISFLIAVLLIPLALVVALGGDALAPVAGAILVIGGLNLVLAALSMLPGLPLDGGRIVRALAWLRTGDKARAGRVAAKVGRLLGWTLVGGGLALTILDQITAGILLLLLGWFLSSGAKTMEKRLGLEDLMLGATVGDATTADVPRIGPHLTIDTFADRYDGEDGVTAMPVVDGDRVLGVIGIRRIRRLGRRRFASTRASDIMATPPQAPFLSTGADLWTAVELINRLGTDGLAVVEEGALVGMVTRASIGGLVARRMGAQPTPGGRP